MIAGEPIMERETAQALGTGVVGGIVTAYGVVKMWLKRVEEKLVLVDSHETRLAVIEQAQVTAAKTAEVMAESVKRMESVTGQIAVDVAYLRGLREGEQQAKS